MACRVKLRLDEYDLKAIEVDRWQGYVHGAPGGPVSSYRETVGQLGGLLTVWSVHCGKRWSSTRFPSPSRQKSSRTREY